MRYQFYTQDKTGKVLHAGVHTLGSFSHRTIKKLERKWQSWRHDYVLDHPGDYPLSQEAKRMPLYVTVFPIDSPDQKQLFTV